jgi:DNA-binding response OmpR family regulator
LFESQGAIRLGQTNTPDSAFPTVLIVEDEPEVAATYARVLETSGFTCLVAYDGAQALLLFDSQQPALVLSDINLRIGDGFEIARYVRQTSPGTPVILMTGYDRVDSLQRASQVGAAAYLRKPFTNSELVSTINLLIQRS